MATKPRKRKPARQDRLQAIPAYRDTGAKEALDAAVAGGDYIADLDGAPPHWVIKRLSTGEITHCPNVHAPEVHARVALLNRGTPTKADNQSWGRFMSAKPRRGKGGKPVKAIEGKLTATQWFAYLYGPLTADALRAYVPAGAKKPTALDDAALLDLMRHAGGALADHVDDLMLDAVSQQLADKLGIRRGSAAKRWAVFNDPDSWDDGT